MNGIGTRERSGGWVHVWTVPLDRSRADVSRLARLLSPADRDRATARTLATDRDDFVVAHAALRAVSGRYLRAAPAEVEFRTGPTGRPDLVLPASQRHPVSVNLSHSGRFAVVAVSSRTVGVDIERARRSPPPVALARRFFTPAESAEVDAAEVDAAERAAAEDGVTGGAPCSAGAVDVDGRVFLRLWTRKEACVKAAGSLLARGLRLPVGGPGPTVVTDRGNGLGAPGAWFVQDVPAPPGYAIAVAVAGPSPCRLRSMPAFLGSAGHR